MLTQRPFPNVSEPQVASTASSRCHVAATPSTWPSESLSVSRVHGDSFATVSVPHREAEDALSESAQYIAQRCDPVEESEVDRLRRELAEALEKDDDVEEPSEATSDDIDDWAKRVSRFVGVAWDEKRRKWKVTLNELDGKDRTIGRYDDEREAAYARNKAVLDAGLEGRRRMNAVDEHGVLVPPGAPHRRAKASVIAPDPLAVTKYGVSKYWGVTWDRKGRVWRAQYTDGDGKRKSVGRYGNEEEAAYAYNDAIRDAGLEGVRKVNPVVDGCVEINRCVGCTR